MTRHRSLSCALLCLFLVGAAAAPARAERIALEGFGPFALRPGDVLRGEFDLRGVTIFEPLETLDVLLFAPGVSVVQPIGSYTARLYDRGRLLGTYTSTSSSDTPPIFRSWFAATGSIFTLENPTFIDFSTFRDGTFDGAVEFEIHDGLANIFRASDELDLGRALTPLVASGSGFAPRTYEIITPAAVPEPASLLLFASGAACVAIRRRYGRGSTRA